MIIEENKTDYANFLEDNGDYPIFLNPAWLTLNSSNGEWLGYVIKNKNQAIASFATFKKKRGIIEVYTVPKLTPYLGLWLGSDLQNRPYLEQIEYIHRIQETIIQEFKYSKFQYFAFHYSIHSFLPYVNQGYLIKPRYTYLIKNVKDYNFEQSISRRFQRKLKTLKKSHEYSLEQLSDHNQFYEFHRSLIENKIKYTRSYIENLFKLIHSKSIGKAFVLKDLRNNKIMSGALIIWDSTTAYNLITFSNREYNGAFVLLMSEMLKELPNYIDTFDFEGSIIKGVESIYRGLSNTREIYYSFRKHPFQIF